MGIGVDRIVGIDDGSVFGFPQSHQRHNGISIGHAPKRNVRLPMAEATFSAIHSHARQRLPLAFVVSPLRLGLGVTVSYHLSNGCKFAMLRCASWLLHGAHFVIATHHVNLVARI
eukprot:COSAG01_NODE_2326_length_7903_cov_22.624552_7_plen_115_part_00